VILAWVNDIFEGLDAFITGMRTTGRFLVENLSNKGGATAVTRQYPQEPAEVIGSRGRGHLVNKADNCIVCFACDKACPVDCFKMEGERDANNKMRASLFDIDLSKCIYCGLCVRACPTDSLSMTSHFEMDPKDDKEGHFLFRRNSSQLGVRLEAADMQRLHALADRPYESLSPDDRTWLDARIDQRGQHLIGMYGLGYFTPEEKAKADAEREAKKKAKDAAAAAAAKAKAAAAPAATPTAPAPAAPAPAAKPPAASSPAASSPAVPPAGSAPAVSPPPAGEPGKGTAP
jgi:formate hydrogenlyase subunit 6/NADH:ubiquinone oxidoreductase subunit I